MLPRFSAVRRQVFDPKRSSFRRSLLSLAWIDAPALSTASIVADFNNDRYALPPYGAELVPDPTADDPAKWSLNDAGTSVTEGVVRLNNAAQFTLITPTNPGINLVGGRLYEIRYTIKNWVAGSVRFQFTGGDATLSGTTRAGNGTYIEYRVAIGAQGFRLQPSTVATLDIDDISVREVVLDPVGRTYGVELVANGAFTSDTAGWTNASGGTTTFTFDSGAGLLTSDGSNSARARQGLATTVGKIYELRYTATHPSGSQGGSALSLGTTVGGAEVASSQIVSGSDNRLIFTATATTTHLQFARGGTGSTRFDDVSVREITAWGTYPKRTATFEEVFALAAASTSARSYVDATGAPRTDLAANQRRFTWVNGKRQLRLEDARTNLLLHSNSLDSTGNWPRISLLSPAGMQAVDGLWPLIYSTTSAGPRVISQQITKTAIATQYTLSFTARAGDRPNLYATIDDNGVTNRAFAQFNLSGTGTVMASGLGAGTFTGVSATITRIGTTDRYRCSITATTGPETVVRGMIGPATGVTATSTTPNSSPVSGNAGDVALWVGRVNLEAAAFASDWIPTANSAVTRAIETCRFSPLVEAILQREAATVTSRQTIMGSTGVTRRIIGGLGSTFIHLSAQGSLGAFNGAASLASPSGKASPDIPFGAAYAFDAAGRSMCSPDGTIVSDASGAGNRTQVFLARDAASAAGTFGDGFYDAVLIAPERLPNATLQTLAVAA